MLENDFFIAIKAYIFELFKNSLSPQAVYHNFNHTVQVVNACYEIAREEKVSEKEIEILLVAAWFHDSGYVKGFENHEESSKEIATEYLQGNGMSDENISTVLSIIDATKMPQNPKTLLEKIICDSDLFHIGSEDFKMKSNLLRSEWELLCDRVLTDVEWFETNEEFLASHSYFTNYAFEKLEPQKNANWLKLAKDLKKARQKEERLKAKAVKNTKSVDRPDRGIETMFRVTLRNHIKLSDIADTKANILLSVSAIILSIALSTLFPKLDKASNAYLIWPTLIFIFMTVATMVLSILSTRPKITPRIFSKDDIAKKKVNLLFFGNFYKMPLADFQEGMTAMMNDREYLYNSLMKDLYFLGVVLNKKYRLLRVAYTVFMIGIVVSVFAFLISFAMLERS